MIGVKTFGAVLCAAMLTAATAVDGAELRVCADPDNPPFTTRSGEGFSNIIAERVAAEMGRSLIYHWRGLGIGFLRQTLQAKVCDVVMDYAANDWRVLSTAPYYRSSFVLTVRRDSDLASVGMLDDTRLVGRRIGVVAGGPPAAHLARLGLISDARPYPLTVDRQFKSPDASMLDDLNAGVIDAAIVWGPLAGSKIAADPNLIAVPLMGELPPPLAYDITMAVRLGDEALKVALEEALIRLKPEIDAILRDANVPLLSLETQTR